MDLSTVVLRFGEKARLVLFHARREVSLTGATALEPEHVALGLLCADESLVGAHLNAGWTIPQLESELTRGLTPGGRVLPDNAEVPITPVVRALILRAAENADRQGAEDIQPMHLLAAMVQDETSRAGRVLRDAGISADAF